MIITIQNQAQIPNKYIRFAKWKIRQLDAKFNKLIYAEVFIQKEGTKKEVYMATVRLGVEGHDIIVSERSENLREMWAMMSTKIKRQLRKYTARHNKNVKQYVLT